MGSTCVVTRDAVFRSVTCGERRQLSAAEGERQTAATGADPDGEDDRGRRSGAHAAHKRVRVGQGRGPSKRGANRGIRKKARHEHSRRRGNECRA